MNDGTLDRPEVTPFVYLEDATDILAMHRDQTAQLAALREITGPAIVDESLAKGAPYVVGIAASSRVLMATAANDVELYAFLCECCDHYANKPRQIRWHVALPEPLRSRLEEAVLLYALGVMPVGGHA